MILKKVVEHIQLEQLTNLPLEDKVTGVFCCDLLSHAMAKLPQGAVWVTVMANPNTLAVASLAEAACVILAQNVQVEEKLIEIANEKNVILFKSVQPIFETAKAIDRAING